MKTEKYIMTIFVWTICFAMNACSNQTTDKAQKDTIIVERISTANQQTDSVTNISLNMQKDELTKIYTKAIAEFIKAAYKKDKTTFDTLFFGKHVYGQPDDFQDIVLPETIEKTPVMLITPEVGQKKQQENNSLVYINMMGWVDNEKAMFLFVVFSNGAQHQYDYFINFLFNATRKDFELETIEFENYKNSHGQKPERFTIYKDGKYLN